jgi:hypothetical protein
MSHDEQNAQDEGLRRELHSVRKVNEAIEEAIESLAKARNSMKVSPQYSRVIPIASLLVNCFDTKELTTFQTVNTTVASASSLLSTWTKILSQTEHNQRLILNPSWHGASQDLADAEQETLMKQQAAERKDYEEQERRLAVARKTEDDERRRAEAAARVPRGSSRGRGRGLGRGGGTASTSNTSYVGVGGQGGTRGATRGSSTARRTTSGIGRGIGSVRGRGKA